MIGKMRFEIYSIDNMSVNGKRNTIDFFYFSIVSIAAIAKLSKEKRKIFSNGWLRRPLIRSVTVPRTTFGASSFDSIVVPGFQEKKGKEKKKKKERKRKMI